MKIKLIYYLIFFSILQSCSNNKQVSEEKFPILLSNSNNKASCVFLTKDEQNNPVISWTEVDSAENKHFYFANWNKKLQKFDAGISIPIESITSFHEEGMPKIAFKGDGTLFATYETSVPSEKSKYGLSNIQYIMSFDKGKTWTSPKSIQSDDQNDGSRSFGNIIQLKDGELGASWLGTNIDKTKSGRPVMFAKTIGREGFGNAVMIEPSACQCCRTALSCDEKGDVSIVFRNLLSGSVRDISVSNSNDNGNTFNKSNPFSNDNWVIDGCPHNGPSVVSNTQAIFVTWFTGSKQKGVYYAELDKQNKMLEKRQLDPNGRFVQLCIMPDGERIMAYNVNYNQDDSMYNKIVVTKKNEKGYFDKEITFPKAHASYPVLQPIDKQNVIIAWTDNEKTYFKTLNINDITVAKTEVLTEPSSVKTFTSLPPLEFENDPVCGMKIDNRTAADTTVFNSKIIGFCSQGCKEMFIKKPLGYPLMKHG